MPVTTPQVDRRGAGAGGRAHVGESYSDAAAAVGLARGSPSPVRRPGVAARARSAWRSSASTRGRSTRSRGDRAAACGGIAYVGQVRSIRDRCADHRLDAMALEAPSVETARCRPVFDGTAAASRRGPSAVPGAARRHRGGHRGRSAQRSRTSQDTRRFSSRQAPTPPKAGCRLHDGRWWRALREHELRPAVSPSVPRSARSARRCSR